MTPGAGARAPRAGESPELDRLRAEARFHRERLDLYTAKAKSGRAIQPARLRELQRASDGAEARLRAARARDRRPAPAATGGS